MMSSTESLFTNDYSVNRGIMFIYNFYTDQLEIRHQNDVWTIDLNGLRHHNTVQWIRIHVDPILKSIDPMFTVHDLYDIGRSIVQLARRYWIEYPVKHITESMCNQFQKLIEAHAHINEQNESYEACESYQKIRTKFIKKFNWLVYHFLILSVRGFNFNLNDYSITNFNAFMNKIVNKEEIAAIQCYRP